MPTTLTCLKCGGDLRPGDRFCAACGNPADPTIDLASGVSVEDESPWTEVVQRLRRATLGEFEIGRELGRGGMAAVFLAHEISLDRKVAIKVMSPGLLMGEGMIERFKREAITIAHLNHPNIVSVYSVRQAEGLHFFVMRYIRGRSLEQLIHEAGRLPVPMVRSILCHVSSALTYAHRSRVVHRDIKPANILIDEEGNAVVTDFGIAKVAKLPGHTHTGALVGTPAYMSPEQCNGAEVSGASDQYSLGAVAFEMVTGVAPFTGSALTVMQAQVEQAPPPIHAHYPECPPDFEAAILRMLAKDPAERFPNMAQAKAALGAVPLAEDDPLFAELCRLAAAGRSRGLSEETTPTSPVPLAGPVTASRSMPAGAVRAIVILPPPADLEIRESFSLVALVRGERGMPLPGRAVRWSTDAPEVLRIDQSRAVATVVAPGTAALTAACEGVQAVLQVHVHPPAPELTGRQRDQKSPAIQISTPPRSVRVGDSFVLTATPFDRGSGRTQDQTVHWSTSDVRVAVVTAGGWVAALGRGRAVLTATSNGVSASVAINVQDAIPAPRPPALARPTPAAKPVRPVRPAASPALTTEPAPVIRPGRRRRRSSSRRRVMYGTAGAVLLGGLLWHYRGAYELRGDPPARSEAAPPAPVAQTTPQQGPADSVAPINRGAGSAAPARRRVRRTAPEAPPAPVSVAIAPAEPVRAGDTVTLAAVVLDEKGEPLPGAGIAWSSSQPLLAAVEESTGRVRGHAPGTVLIIARSGAATAMSELTVLPPDTSPEPAAYAPSDPEPPADDPPQEVAAPEPTPSPPRAAEPAVEPRPEPAAQPPVESPVQPPAEPLADIRKVESRMRAGVKRCYDALRSKNAGRLAEIYQPATVSDEDKLRRLTRILRTETWQAVVGKRFDGAREIGPRSAAMEFSVPLTWRDPIGAHRTSQPIFRAEFSRVGTKWQMSSCRIVGSPNL